MKWRQRWKLYEFANSIYKKEREKNVDHSNYEMKSWTRDHKIEWNITDLLKYFQKNNKKQKTNESVEFAGWETNKILWTLLVYYYFFFIGKDWKMNKITIKLVKWERVKNKLCNRSNKSHKTIPWWFFRGS